MSDTQQAAIRLLASLPMPYLDNLPDAVASTQYDTDLEIAVQFLTQAEQRGMERAAGIVREKCGACSGTGYGRVSWDEHGNFVDGDECEHCGRPAQAIRQAKEKA
ncbi:MAG: hypothetical protein Q7U76_12725 [Nitrospirota bacterium]|nr:hypothetical protein [Nitrospirota bacterium]